MAHFIGIQGPLGAGKTTAASMLAHYYRNRVVFQGGDIKLFSNYGLRGAEKMRKPEDWFKVAEAHGSICVWDEGQEQFDSREFSSAERIFSTKLLNYCRKMASLQMIVAPSFRNIDTRIRQLTEVLINVTKVGNKGIRLEYFDYQSGDKDSSLGRFLHSRFLPAWKVKQIHSLNLFNTFRLVTGFPMPKTPRAQAEFMEKLNMIHNQALARLGYTMEHEDDANIDLEFLIGEEKEDIA